MGPSNTLLQEKQQVQAPNQKKSRDDSSDSDNESEDEADDKTRYCTISLKLDPTKSLDEEGNKVTHKIPIFEGGSAEDYCLWREAVDEVFERKEMGNNMREMSNHFQSFLRGKARDDFLNGFSQAKDHNQSAAQRDKLSQQAMTARALNAVAQRIFTHAEFSAAIQRRYLRQRIPFGDTNVVDYVDRLCKINNWFPYFPVDNDTIITGNKVEFPQPLPEDELMDILHYSQPIEWQVRSLQHGSFGFYDDIKTMAQAFRRYQTADELEERAHQMVKYYQAAHSKGTNTSNGNSNNKTKRSHKADYSSKPSNSKRRNGSRHQDDSSITSHGSESSNSSSNSSGTHRGSRKRLKSRCKHCGKFHRGECWYAPDEDNSSATDDDTASQKKPRRHNKKLVKTNDSPPHEEVNTIESDSDDLESYYMKRLHRSF